MKRKLIIGVICMLLALLPGGMALGEEESAIKIVDSAVLDGKYRVDTYRGEGISFLELSSDAAADRAPLIILQHGAYNNKGHMIDAAKVYADMGYVVVAPDLAGHGDNITDTPLNMYDMISQSAGNTDSILSFYDTREYVDAQRFALAGHSLGGMTVLYYAAYGEREPACVFTFNATPDLGSLVESNSIYVWTQNGQAAPMTSRKDAILVGADLIRNSPDQNMEKLLSKPILMINGDQDAQIPLAPVQAFCERARQEFPDNQLTLTVQQGHNHDFTPADARLPEVAEFLAQYLPPQQ